MNILITSVGRRTQLLKYFKKELGNKGRLIATDVSRLAPAIYVADKYYTVPRIDEDNYIDVLLDICMKENVNALFSLIDPELSILAKHAERFESIGVKPIVSPYEVCELWLDKFQSGSFCRSNGFNFAKTYNNFDQFEDALKSGEINFPVFLKPQKGSASLNINVANNIDEAKIIFCAYPQMIIQELLVGQELGVDVYVDIITKDIISIFIKEKIAMRAGETDKARSIKSDELMDLIKRLINKAGLIGPIDIDVFYINGDYYISEINPRFGGGYLLAYECGANFPRYIINNLSNVPNTVAVGEYDNNVIMMKHDTISILKEEI